MYDLFTQNKNYLLQLMGSRNYLAADQNWNRKQGNVGIKEPQYIQYYVLSFCFFLI